MGKRGPKPKSEKSFTWSPELVYAIGLIATDGCLYNDGRHINFTTKDLQLARTFKQCLNLQNKIGSKNSGYGNKRSYYVVQFGNIGFYNFLIKIGLTTAKSKTIGKILIPKKYIPDLIRGLFDGDGSFYYYYDPRWKSSFLFYLSFASASKNHLLWLQGLLKKRLGVIGHGIIAPYKGVYQLKFAKAESRKIIKMLYYKSNLPCLERKREKVHNALIIDNKKK